MMTMTGDEVTTYAFWGGQGPTGTFVKHEDYVRLQREVGHWRKEHDHLQQEVVVQLSDQNAELRRKIVELEAERDKLSLAYIEASNPGIDMDEVRASMERTQGRPE